MYWKRWRANKNVYCTVNRQRSTHSSRHTPAAAGPPTTSPAGTSPAQQQSEAQSRRRNFQATPRRAIYDRVLWKKEFIAES